ncbi:hypothetical protein [Criblamydia sequanensis]|uniref:Conserved putative membrane protein n=1 Tax=Candidatus Criblamydia sequanensis CRIB-18 TaxID=1437425 RepID=A0A090D2H2_9BACT|nr:hypothetical protein [Criblamydia sequanensis]CDR34348.1 Conserved putative membrane protein [Criblamydia sequanensis CRIB-18]
MSSKTLIVFNKKSTLFFIWLVLPLLFIPKINLISMGESETAGIRLDDVILLGFAFIYLFGSFALSREPLKIECFLAAIIFFSIVSFFLNRSFVFLGIIDVQASLFYAVRPLEYFLFFYIGYQCYDYFSLSSIMQKLFVWNASLMLLQKAGIIGAFTNYGYLSNVQDRVTGLCSFPSETGAFLNLLFCYLLFATKPPKKLIQFFGRQLGRFFYDTYFYWLCLFTAYLVILTGSRIALCSHFLVFFIKVIKDLTKGSKVTKFYAAFFLVMGAFVGILGILATESIYHRSRALFSWQNIELVRHVWDEIETFYNPMGNEIVSLTSDYDTSWWLRIHKWCYAFKIFYKNPEVYLMGVGPGFAFAGLDGGFLRILVELGVVGLILHFLFFRELFKISLAMKAMILTFSINMIFFDAYLAYKVMALLFFAAGYDYHVKKNLAGYKMS